MTETTQQVRARRRRSLFVGGVVALVAVGLVSATSGAMNISIAEVWAALRGGADLDPTIRSVLVDIRFPRVVLGMLVGASMAASGAVLQGSFANPLAEPGIIGVTAGSAVGAVIYIVSGAAVLGTFGLSAAALFGGMAAIAPVYTSPRRSGRTDIVTLVLTGIAVNAFAGAIIGLLSYLASDAQLRGIVFWTLGSLAQASWSDVVLVTIMGGGGIALAWSIGRALDVVSLGEVQAQHLGIPVERIRIISLFAAALAAAGATAVAGQILFVGLVIPHAVRMLIGPSHRALILGSALVGAVLVALADVVARTIVAPAELPLGVLTALVVAPVFFRQIRKSRLGEAT